MTDSTQQTAASGDPRPFNQWLLEQRGGSLHGELSDRMQELVAAVAIEGKTGSLTITIKVSPAAAGTNQFVVTDDVKVKSPEPERGASLFFADPAGNLSRSDPRQPELPLREATKPSAHVREVS